MQRLVESQEGLAAVVYLMGCNHYCGSAVVETLLSLARRLRRQVLRSRRLISQLRVA